MRTLRGHDWMVGSHITVRGPVQISQRTKTLSVLGTGVGDALTTSEQAYEYSCMHTTTDFLSDLCHYLYLYCDVLNDRELLNQNFTLEFCYILSQFKAIRPLK